VTDRAGAGVDAGAGAGLRGAVGAGAEAVALANSTRYGLAATLFTGDRERASRVSALLAAGTVWVNCFFVRDLRAPFGGAKQSGIGREGGTWSFDFYGDVKNTVYAPEGWHRG
jgi:5-carboxymethyl-2-hydroxymuconic-semialdehyde dehydrogenase